MAQRRASTRVDRPRPWSQPLGSSFEDRVGRRIRIDPSGCWMWTGRTDPKGYGLVDDGPVIKAVHRVVYETMVAPIPDGHHVHHDCEVRACCNPAHLRVLTPSQHAAHHHANRRRLA